MRKDLLRILALLSFVLFFASSCTPTFSPPNMEPTRLPTTLRLWLWPGSGLESLIKRYLADHPGIDVEIVTHQYDDIVPNLMTSFATRSDAPDLVLLEDVQLNRMKRFQNNFYNLYDFGDERVHFLDWQWRQGENREGDFLFGLPVGTGPVALAYRHDLFAKAGLPSEREQVAATIRTWDDLERAGLLLKQKTGAALFDNLTNVYVTYFNQYEEPSSNPEALLPRVKEAWDRAIRFQRLGLSAGLQSQTPAWAEGAVNDRFAAVLGPSWMHGLMKKNAPATAGKWDLARAPGRPANWNGTYLAVPKSSRYPREAYELARWLTAPAQQLSNFIANGNFPSTPETFSSMQFLQAQDSFFHDAPVGQIYSYTALRYKPGYEEEDLSEIDRRVRDGLLNVESEGADPEQIWQAIYRQIEQQGKGE